MPFANEYRGCAAYINHFKSVVFKSGVVVVVVVVVAAAAAAAATAALPRLPRSNRIWAVRLASICCLAAFTARSRWQVHEAVSFS